MHGRPHLFLALFKLNPDRLNSLIDDIDARDFWPISRIPRDFVSFNGKCARTACENIKWVRDSLVEFLEKVTKDYMQKNIIKLVSRIYTEEEVTEDELRSNWSKYVTEKEPNSVTRQ